jgi:uncharacterized membrane protein
MAHSNHRQQLVRYTRGRTGQASEFVDALSSKPSSLCRKSLPRKRGATFRLRQESAWEPDEALTFQVQQARGIASLSIGLRVPSRKPMPTVKTSVWINAPIEKVFAIARDTEQYPTYMKEVDSITPVERDGSRLVADWVGIVPTFGLKIRWRQEEIWDDDRFRSQFRQIQGDYDRLEGTWEFHAENGGTRFEQFLDYEYNVPTLASLVKKVIHTIVVKNLESINEAFKSRAELA